MKPKKGIRYLFYLFTKTILCWVLIALAAIFGIDKGIGKLAPKFYPTKYSEFVEEYSAKYNVDKSFCYAFIKCESNFKPDAESEVGAAGLMQLTSDNFCWVTTQIYGNSKADELRYDPEMNIKCGIWFLAYLGKQFKDESSIIAAYNAGPENVKKWLKNKKYSEDGISLTSTPYDETSFHIKKILHCKKMYKKLYKI